MIHLDLTHEEQELLRQLVEEQLSELRMEIAGTDRQEYRDGLKQRKAVLLKLQESIAPELRTPPS